jgi:exodeoxyribonuclease III
LRLSTWNVNGIRARAAQVQEWLDGQRPDVLCLQELKASADQIPQLLLALDGYWSFWHGLKAYSGVSIHVRRELCEAAPACLHPEFDYEARIATLDVPGMTVASVYVPNGGKDYEAKLRFLESLAAYAERHRAAGTPLVICGDLNVAHTDRDVHPKERKPRAVGQLPEERALFDRLLAGGLVDLARALHPDDDQMFTWWAPWRNLRDRNIGWRIDYVLASNALARRTTRYTCDRTFGTSDHGPLLVELTL